MTRDQIAAMAMQGILASSPEGFDLIGMRYSIVHEAVALADALIAELKRTAQPAPERKK